jgi:hypothetical protein
MPYSDKHKLIFVHIPKNAGTAITNTLEMIDEGHHTYQYYQNRYSERWKNYTKFCIVRNPWERVVSCYEYAKLENSYWHSSDGGGKAGKHPDYELLKDKTFVECLEILNKTPNQLKHHGWASQSQYVFNGDLTVNKVIRMEKINEGLSELLKDNFVLPQINVSNSNNYRDYYKTDEHINIVRRRYKIDIDLFNYEF